MATKNWNNDFMAKVLEEAAWKELSSEFAWNEQLLEKYKDKVAWKEISDNSNILWTVSICLERTTARKVQGQGGVERDFRQQQYPLDCIHDREVQEQSGLGGTFRFRQRTFVHSGKSGKV